MSQKLDLFHFSLTSLLDHNIAGEIYGTFIKITRRSFFMTKFKHQLMGQYRTLKSDVNLHNRNERLDMYVLQA